VFEAELAGYFEPPGFAAKWLAALDAPADRLEFGLALRAIHVLKPVTTERNWGLGQESLFVCGAMRAAIDASPSPRLGPPHDSCP
jgi:hypothetical protein